MGIYLSAPKTEKASEDGENDRLRYGLSSMQGWRATMEDAVSSLCIFIVPTCFGFHTFAFCIP
jgi:protein phosphatase 1G